MKGTKKIIGK